MGSRVHLTSVVTALTILIGGSGLLWGALNLQRSAIADELHSYAARLLRFEGFAPAAAQRIVDSDAIRNLSDCDTQAQRALVLLEIPLAEAAMRSGATGDFDRHMRSIADRSGRILTCAPRDSLAWLLLFGLEVTQGRIGDHAFELLAASYETSPNEAWVALRRVTVATPVLLSAPEGIRQKILDEFKNLVRHRYVEIPVRAFLAAPASAQKLLQARIEELDTPSQELFARTVQELRS